jgi:hypothetical protein
MNGSTTEAGEVLYAVGYIRHFLETYSFGCSLSTNELASRVATLILAQAGGQVLGTSDSLSTLRGEGAKRNKTTRKVALARGPHRKAQRVGKKWSPEQREKFTKTMKAVWARKRAEAA